jgi:aminopeptidase-like protein
MRSVWGTCPEYHTSADNLSFIRSESLARSLQVCASIIEVLEENRICVNQLPWCEPQLGKRGLYRSTGGESIAQEINARLWVLNLSDGSHSLLDIAERSGLPFSAIRDAAGVLTEAGLLTSSF